MQRIKYTNSCGREMEMSSVFPIMVSNVTGLGGASASNTSEKGFMQDGENYYGTVFEPRLISFDIYIQGESVSDLTEKRQNMIKTFNPKLGMGVLTYYDLADGEEVVARQIDCVPDGEIIYGEKLNGVTQKFSVSLLATDPAFCSIEEYRNKLVGFVGGLEVPFEMPFILAAQGDIVEIEYTGDCDAPILVEFRGTATMPKIIKEETGEVIEVEVEIGEGESLFIDTTPFDVDVYKMVDGEKVNANYYVKPTSDYFQLTEGTNTISFSAASGDPEVYITYRERYLGC